MNIKLGGFTALVGVLPAMQNLPAPTRLAEAGMQALCDAEGSASVAELAAVADYLDAMASHPSMPAAARDVLLTARDALLGRRVRNQHGRTGRRAGSGTVSGGVLFTVTAAAGVAVR